MKIKQININEYDKNCDLKLLLTALFVDLEVFLLMKKAEQDLLIKKFKIDLGI